MHSWCAFGFSARASTGFSAWQVVQAFTSFALKRCGLWQLPHEVWPVGSSAFQSTRVLTFFCLLGSEWQAMQVGTASAAGRCCLWQPMQVLATVSFGTPCTRSTG